MGAVVIVVKDENPTPEMSLATIIVSCAAFAAAAAEERIPVDDARSFLSAIRATAMSLARQMDVSAPELEAALRKVVEEANSARLKILMQEH